MSSGAFCVASPTWNTNETEKSWNITAYPCIFQIRLSRRKALKDSKDLWDLAESTPECVFILFKN